MTPTDYKKLYELLERLIGAVENLAPVAPKNKPNSSRLIWNGATLIPAQKYNLVPLDHLCGIDEQKAQLLDNTRRFAKGEPANHALLWGARGMGKSTLVQAIHQKIHEDHKDLILVNLRNHQIAGLEALLFYLEEMQENKKFIIFCDDLSFKGKDGAMHQFKEALEGGLMRTPHYFLLYVTSNLRHLKEREDGGSSHRIDPHRRDSLDDDVSLADRFGLWLGFHPCSEEDFDLMLTQYGKHFGIKMDDATRAQAHAWAMMRGGRSGRIVMQWFNTQKITKRPF